jgi:hypothetical protein
MGFGGAPMRRRASHQPLLACEPAGPGRHSRSKGLVKRPATQGPGRSKGPAPLTPNPQPPTEPNPPHAAPTAGRPAGRRVVLLNGIRPGGQDRMEVWNSPLQEAAVLGFEYGWAGGRGVPGGRRPRGGVGLVRFWLVWDPPRRIWRSRSRRGAAQPLRRRGPQPPHCAPPFHTPAPRPPPCSYSIIARDTSLVLWEAQFGDFANNAQVGLGVLPSPFLGAARKMELVAG